MPENHSNPIVEAAGLKFHKLTVAARFHALEEIHARRLREFSAMVDASKLSPEQKYAEVKAFAAVQPTSADFLDQDGQLDVLRRCHLLAGGDEAQFQTLTLDTDEQIQLVAQLAGLKLREEPKGNPPAGETATEPDKPAVYGA